MITLKQALAERDELESQLRFIRKSALKQALAERDELLFKQNHLRKCARDVLAIEKELNAEARSTLGRTVGVGYYAFRRLERAVKNTDLEEKEGEL